MNNIVTNIGQKLAGESFHIESLNYIPLTKQPELYSRPYTLSTDATMIDLVAERHVQRGDGRVTMDMLSDISSGIIRPSTRPYETSINKDWMSQDRYVFILKVVSTGPLGTINSYITGYTNHDGISRGIGTYAEADPSMVHYTTAVIETITNSLGQESLYRYYNVITDNTTEGIGLIRPIDVVDNLNTRKASRFVESMYADIPSNPLSPIGDGMSNYGYGGYVNDPLDGLHVGYDHNGMPVYGNTTMSPDGITTQVINVSSQLNKTSDYAEISTVTNNNPLNYLTSVLNKGISDVKNNQLSSGVDDNNLSFTSSSISNDGYEDTELNRNRFLSYISSLSGEISPRGIFTFGELLKIDPRGADDFVLGIPIPDALSMDLSDAPHMGGGEYWNGVGPVTITAWSMLQSALAIAAKLGFSVMIMEFNTNTAVMGVNNNVIIRNCYSFTNLNGPDLSHLMDICRSTFYEEVLKPESKNGFIPLSGRVIVNMAGDSKILLSYAGQPETWYTLPTVANSLVIPVIGKDRALLDTTTNMFGTFINSITGGNNY